MSAIQRFFPKSSFPVLLDLQGIQKFMKINLKLFKLLRMHSLLDEVHYINRVRDTKSSKQIQRNIIAIVHFYCKYYCCFHI